MRWTHQMRGFTEGSHDDLRMDTIFYERLALLEEVTGQQHYAGRPVSHLRTQHTGNYSHTHPQ